MKDQAHKKKKKKILTNLPVESKKKRQKSGINDKKGEFSIKIANNNYLRGNSTQKWSNKVGQSGVRGTAGSLEPKFRTVPLKVDQFEIMKIKQM